MASYHCTVKIGTAGKGQPHSDYINREGKYKRYNGQEDLVYSESGNMPYWAKDNAREFWKAADIYERSGEKLAGRAYREIEIALPNELSNEENIAFVKEFVEQELGEKFPYSFAIHNKKATLDKTQDQPHAHIMFCERKLDGIERSRELFFKRANSNNPELGGNKKDVEWKAKERLEKTRKNYEIMQNKYLENAGHNITVDCRSYKSRYDEAIKKGDFELAKTLHKTPQQHLGAKVAQKVSKSVEGYIATAKNKEEREVLTEKYFEQVEKNKKAQLFYFASSLTKIQKDIGLAIKNREIPDIRDENETENHNPDKAKAIPEIIDFIDQKINDEQIKANVIYKDYLNVRRTIFTTEQAEVFATKKALGDKYEPYVQLQRKVEVNTEKIAFCNEEIRAFNQLEKLSVFNFSAKKEYEAKKAAIHKQKETLLSEKALLKKEYIEMHKSVFTPAVYKRIEVIKEQILKANASKELKAESLLTEYKSIKKDISTLDKQKQDLQSKAIILNKSNMQQSFAVEPAQTTKQAIRSADKVIKQINKDMQTRGLSANQLNQEGEREYW